MRKAQYRLPGIKSADDATLAVFFFQMGGGSVDANLSRWYKQFRTADGKAVAEPKEKIEITANPRLAENQVIHVKVFVVQAFYLYVHSSA